MERINAVLVKLFAALFLIGNLVSCQKATPTTAPRVATSTAPKVFTKTSTSMITTAAPTKIVEVTSQRTSTLTARPTIISSSTLTSRPTVVNSATSQPTPAIPVKNFSSSTWQKTPPADILQQLADGQFGGGESLTFCGEYKTGQTALFDASNPNKEKVMQQYHWQTFTTCGWQKKEAVQALLTYPTGKNISKAITADDIYGGLEYDFIAFPGDPLGTYAISFQGKAGKTGFSFQVTKVSAPGIVKIETGKLLVFGFQPNEKIRLVSYQSEKNGILRIQGVQEFQVDSNGLLFITTDIKVYISPGGSIYNIYVIGEKSGTFPENWNKLIQFACPGAPVVRFSTASNIKTVTIIDVRVSPGFSQKKVAQLKQGEIAGIGEGPICADKTVWWKIRDGWIPESIDGKYVLQDAY